MKRRIRKVSNIIIALAAVMALIIGLSLGTIGNISRNIIDRIFPVTYDVEFLNGQHAALSDAKVVFSGDRALISAQGFKGTVDMNDAIFSCTDETVLSHNTVRSGVLYILISFAAFAAAASVAWFGVEVRYLAVRKVKRPTVRNADHGTHNIHRKVYASPHAA